MKALHKIITTTLFTVLVLAGLGLASSSVDAAPADNGPQYEPSNPGYTYDPCLYQNCPPPDDPGDEPEDEPRDEPEDEPEDEPRVPEEPQDDPEDEPQDSSTSSNPGVDRPVRVNPNFTG